MIGKIEYTGQFQEDFSEPVQFPTNIEGASDYILDHSAIRPHLWSTPR